MSRFMTSEQVDAHQKRIRKPQNDAGRAFPASGTQAPKKYKNRACGAYSSQKEARRAQELKLLEQAGQIRNLREQVSYELLPRQYVDGKMVEREVRYISDFSYDELVTGSVGIWVPVVEDCKSEPTKTPEYRLKRKMLLWFNGIQVRET